MGYGRVTRRNASQKVFKKQLIGQIQNGTKTFLILRRNDIVVQVHEVLQQKIQLAHTAAALPPQAGTLVFLP